MFKRILIPTDGSKIAEKAVKAGIRFAKEIGAGVVGYYAIEPVQAYYYSEGAMIDGRLIAEFDRQSKSPRPVEDSGRGLPLTRDISNRRCLAPLFEQSNVGGIANGQERRKGRGAEENRSGKSGAAHRRPGTRSRESPERVPRRSAAEGRGGDSQERSQFAHTPRTLGEGRL